MKLSSLKNVSFILTFVANDIKSKMKEEDLVLLTYNLHKLSDDIPCHIDKCQKSQ